MIKIGAFSDSHNLHEKLKINKFDILICAGDATNQGSFPEVCKFLNWFGQQESTHKVYVPGNHDWLAQREPGITKDLCDQNNIKLLINEGIQIEGINIWGSPVTPFFCNWAFNAFSDELKKTWNLIPENLDILITHGPPYNILDKNGLDQSCGCNFLFDEIQKKKPRCHIFGHIHENNGLKEFNGTKFYNVSICNDCYRIENEVMEIDL
jgi:Icc-related predicted phosphoesterase